MRIELTGGLLELGPTGVDGAFVAQLRPFAPQLEYGLAFAGIGRHARGQFLIYGHAILRTIGADGTGLLRQAEYQQAGQQASCQTTDMRCKVVRSDKPMSAIFVFMRMTP